MTRGVGEPLFTHDLKRWQAWQDRQRRLSRWANRARHAASAEHSVTPLMITGPPDAEVIVAFDTTNPPMVRTFAAVIRTLRAQGTTVAVVDAGDARLRGEIAAPTEALDPQLLHAAVYLSIGHFARVGQSAWRASRRSGGRFTILQHGLLTPFTPPLAVGSHLLAWSDADAVYWSAARADISTATVGAPPLVWAREDASTKTGGSSLDRPLFLGQMHGAELPWRTKVGTAVYFCRRTGAEYRPHPSEQSALARAAHRLLRTAGVTFESGGPALSAERRPVVSMFSTGLLEAAAAGLHTYGFAVRPPQWLEAFWERYQIGRWPDRPTQLDPSLIPGTSAEVVSSIVREVTP